MAEGGSEHFRIDPMVVFKLGQELITDETQALLELIKNAYDADATFVAVVIDTHNRPSGTVTAGDKGQPGFIELIDDGTGMDLGEVRDGWLLIARSQKADLKSRGGETQGGRTPLGDKGLGRLGAQRLGWGLQLETKTKDAKRELMVGFSWGDFFNAKTLEEVGVNVQRRTPRRTHGTTVRISELNDPDRWRGDGASELQGNLSKVISPYEGVEGFTISVTLDGDPIDLQDVNRRVLETAHLHYDIKFDGKRLRIVGRADLEFFRPQRADEREAFAHFVESDGGKEFLKRLRANPKAADFKLRGSKGKWFASFERTGSLDEMVRGSLPSPGPFRAEVDAFDLSVGADARAEVFGSLAPYRAFIKDLAGIRVYRDGFAVRVDQDWLGLGKQWTSARSYYGLKPDTTLGYVALTARSNPMLIEKTDREGFTDTAHYNSLQELMRSFLSFTEEIQNWLRREFTAYLREKLEELAEVERDATSEGVGESIEETVEEAEEAKETAESAEAEMETALESAETAMSEASDEANDPEAASEKMAQAAETLRHALDKGRQAMGEVSELLVRVESVQARSELLRQEISHLEEQLEQGVEAMGLGLTAEALSHEMFNVADSLAGRTEALNRDLEEGKVDEKAIKRYVAHVRGTVGSLRKELGHFAPSMRYVRERREQIDLGEFTADLVDYYRDRWQDEGISFRVKDDSKETFVIQMGRGRLTQVFDNLLLNSHYWLGVARERGTVKEGRVTIRLHRPRLTISDNGLGVDPTAEETLFDPFVTRKPRGVGRGLGLFIARQLLDAEGCSIALSPKRNDHGRRFQFLLDLERVAND